MADRQDPAALRAMQRKVSEQQAGLRLAGSGLWVPQVSFPGLTELVGENQIAAVSRTAVPVIILKDISTVQTSPVTAGTPPAGQGSFTVYNIVNNGQAGRTIPPPQVHWYVDEGAAGAGTYTYTLTCPAGEVWEFMAFWHSGSMNAAGTNAYKIAANPVAALTATYGAGRLNYMKDTYVTATTTKAMHVKSPKYAAAAANTPYALTSNLDNPDEIVAAAATATPLRELVAELVIYPGGQVEISHDADGAHTYTALRNMAWFKIHYL